MELADIKPYTKNAKRHPVSQIMALAKIVQEVGWRQPVLVNQQGVIVAGHGRWMTWEKYQTELKPIWIMDDKGQTIHGEAEKTPLTPKQEKAYRLADNKLNESDWDRDLIVGELKELDLEGFDITLTGFDRDLILEKDEKDDVIPEEAPSVAQVGDVWQLGAHRVMVGDATSSEDVEKLMGDRKADMFLTDPPYNVDYVGKTKDQLKIKNDSMADQVFRDFIKNALACADNVMKPGAVFYIWHADSEGFNFRGACHDIGWEVRQCLIWNKNTMVMGRQDYHWKHEPCLYGWKEGASHLWNADRAQTTILNFDRPTKSKEHPTMKPVDLMAYLITNNTKGEDIILDTFGGSGSTLIAAQKTGRVCYTLEIDPKYVDVIIKRWEDYSGGKAEKINE